MTEEEIKDMSKEEFDAIPPEEKKSCYDCGWLTAVISWWCSNKKAIKYRGTSNVNFGNLKMKLQIKWPDALHVSTKGASYG